MTRFFPLLESLFYRCSQTKNLDKLMFINKNEPSDLHIGYCKHFDLASPCEVKFDLMEKLEVEFDDGMDYEKFPKVL